MPHPPVGRGKPSIKMPEQAKDAVSFIPKKLPSGAIHATQLKAPNI